MKNFLSISFFLLLGFVGFSQKMTNWDLDASHSNVRFSVDHMVVSEMDGNFKKFNGQISTSKVDLTDAKIDFSIDVNSINTDNEMRDKHLKGDDFFNAEKYPNMTFKSASFKKLSGNKYVLEGDLTIRDVTKRVKFDVTYGGTMKDPYGNTKAGFKAKTTINRKNFNLQWSATTEAGGLVVGDDVEINLNLEFAQKS
ncbi:MAG: YceI family protein [Saprospiraceae bacterium]